MKHEKPPQRLCEGEEETAKAERRIRVWVEGDGASRYTGDSHPTLDPQLIHITALAFQTSEALGRAMIYEAAHLAGFNHPTAY